MKATDIKVSLSVTESEKIITNEVLGSFSGEFIDRYAISSGSGEVIVLIFDKYFMRNSSRASLTVTIDNLSGVTHVHSVGSGGGSGWIINFDWGAASNFENSVYDALRDYIL